MRPRPPLLVWLALAFAPGLGLPACKSPPGGENAEEKKPTPKEPTPDMTKLRKRPAPPEARPMKAVPAAPAAPFDTSGPLGAVAARCNEGNGIDCRYGGLDHLAGRGTPRDPALGMAMLSRACDIGDAQGCVLLVIHLVGPSSVASDPTAALAAAQRACDLADEHCALLGQLYRRGVGVPVDETRYRELLDRACRGGDKHACK